MIGSAERGNGDRPSLQILDRSNLVGGLGSGDNGKQRKAPGDREAADVRADIGIGLESNVQRGGGVIHRPADQRLHRGVTAAGVDDLHIKPMILEVPSRARDFVRHSAKKLAAVGELDLLALRFGARRPRRRNYACNERRTLEQRAPRHVGIRYAGGGFIAAAHGSSESGPNLDTGSSGLAPRLGAARKPYVVT